MPRSVRIQALVWKNDREVKTGSATQFESPWEMSISSDESDISETSNSAKCSCRQNISEGWSTVGIRSMPSGRIEPSMIGRVRSLFERAMLSCRFGTGFTSEADLTRGGLVGVAGIMSG